MPSLFFLFSVETFNKSSASILPTYPYYHLSHIVERLSDFNTPSSTNMRFRLLVHILASATSATLTSTAHAGVSDSSAERSLHV